MYLWYIIYKEKKKCFINLKNFDYNCLIILSFDLLKEFFIFFWIICVVGIFFDM